MGMYTHAKDVCMYTCMCTPHVRSPNICTHACVDEANESFRVALHCSRWGTPWLQTPISSERLGVVGEARNIPELWKKVRLDKSS